MSEEIQEKPRTVAEIEAEIKNNYPQYKPGPPDSLIDEFMAALVRERKTQEE